LYIKRHVADEASIKEVLGSLFSIYHIDVCTYEDELKEAWHSIAGELIFKMTTKFFVSHTCLYISVSSAALKNELLMIRGSLLQKLQEQVPQAGIKNIYIK